MENLFITTSKFSLLSIKWHIVTGKHLILYPEGYTGMGQIWESQKTLAFTTATTISRAISTDLMVQIQFLPTQQYQASAYEACDCMLTPLHMPKTSETCKEKHALFD